MEDKEPGGAALGSGARKEVALFTLTFVIPAGYRLTVKSSSDGLVITLEPP